MSPRTHLLIIDPQNDFCDTPEARRPPGAAPALPVAGADADADMRCVAGCVLRRDSPARRRADELGRRARATAAKLTTPVRRGCS